MAERQQAERRPGYPPERTDQYEMINHDHQGSYATQCIQLRIMAAAKRACFIHPINTLQSGVLAGDGNVRLIRSTKLISW